MIIATWEPCARVKDRTSTRLHSEVSILTPMCHVPCPEPLHASQFLVLVAHSCMDIGWDMLPPHPLLLCYVCQNRFV
jgi:hypothetical protein